MISANIEGNIGALFHDYTTPKKEYGTDEQKTNAEGVPLWVINCLLRQEGSQRTENIRVTIPSKQDPQEHIPGFTPISFVGLRVMTGENNGRTWVSFSADGIANPKNKE